MIRTAIHNDSHVTLFYYLEDSNLSYQENDFIYERLINLFGFEVEDVYSSSFTYHCLDDSGSFYVLKDSEGSSRGIYRGSSADVSRAIREYINQIQGHSYGGIDSDNYICRYYLRDRTTTVTDHLYAEAIHVFTKLPKPLQTNFV